MEENRENQEQELKPELQQPQEEGYVPRPTWQVWAARIGLVLFIGYMIFYYCRLMGVGA